jgi:hypothetical protein
MQMLKIKKPFRLFGTAFLMEDSNCEIPKVSNLPKVKTRVFVLTLANLLLSTWAKIIFLLRPILNTLNYFKTYFSLVFRILFG